MKKSNFGIMLFLVGATGYLIFSLYLSEHKYNYNGITGTYGALLGNDLLTPYVIVCAIGIIGIIICIYETYLIKLKIFKKTKFDGQSTIM